jgi:hypothetical protein
MTRAKSMPSYAGAFTTEPLERIILEIDGMDLQRTGREI